jgi:hypothetical protein
MVWAQGYQNDAGCTGSEGNTFCPTPKYYHKYTQIAARPSTTPATASLLSSPGLPLVGMAVLEQADDVLADVSSDSRVELLVGSISEPPMLVEPEQTL